MTLITLSTEFSTLGNQNIKVSFGSLQVLKNLLYSVHRVVCNLLHIILQNWQ